jgi:pilus assembly protein Flp/PilA
MKNILSSVTNFIREEDGATAVEYGVLVALIAVAIIAVVVLVGKQVSAAFQSVVTCMSNKTC